jgi:hypothetical protein
MSDKSISRLCPFCRKFTALHYAPLLVGGEHYGQLRPLSDAVGDPSAYAVYQSDARTLWWLARCHSCRNALLVQGIGRTIYPTTIPVPVHAKIPQPMRSDLAEAKKCQTVSAYNAAVVMARRALQNAAVEQGAPRKRENGRDVSLWAQLNWLKTKARITHQQWVYADAVRWIGNHGAHDEEPELRDDDILTITDVTAEDAETAIHLVEELCRTIYVLPEMAQQQIDKRRKELGSFQTQAGDPKAPVEE